MPVFLTLNGDNKGTIADTVVINNYPTPHAQPQRREVEDIVPVEQQEPTATAEPAPEPNLEKFRSLLTVPYLNRKRECDAMIDLITQDGWSKKDRARFALALYESGNVALKREHISTFALWYDICRELLGWGTDKLAYRRHELTPNEATDKIKLYL